ncbi:MAG: aspartyl protease family protein [Altererythrobacter sp.]|nr:aspartyl protease family protein [Altererythrobacter sp.]
MTWLPALVAAAVLATSPAAASCIALERGDEGTPIIRASINGTEPLAFVLDTAASGTTIDPAVAKRLALPNESGTQTAQGMGGGIDVVLHRILSLRAGPINAQDLSVPALPAPDFRSHAVAGLAGIDVFGKQMAVWAPRDNCVLVLANGTPLRDGTWHNARANWVQPWKIMVPVRIGRVDGWALLDTGAQYTTLNPRFAERLGLDVAKLKPAGAIAGIDGRELQLREARLDHARVGPWRWTSPTVRVGALPVFERLAMAGDTLAILGMDWLSDRRFAIDYGNRSVWLSASQAAPASHRQAEMSRR